jgi:hypothetical protein
MVQQLALEAQHVFCALYQVGLLGYVHHDWVRGEWVQRFLRPGEGTLQPDGVLPAAEHYVVHPVLSEVIGRFNPLYLQRIDRVNIVGHGLPWRATPSWPWPTWSFWPATWMPPWLETRRCTRTGPLATANGLVARGGQAQRGSA